MPRIDRPSIDADRVVVAAKLDVLVPALVAMRAQRLQLAIPEFDRIVVVGLDVIGDASCDDFAFAQAHRTQRFALKLTACSTMPRSFAVQLGHSPPHRHITPEDHLLDHVCRVCGECMIFCTWWPIRQMLLQERVMEHSGALFDIDDAENSVVTPHRH
jgi:hypothetical protein